MNINIMWIARDKTCSLYIYTIKPHKENDYWKSQQGDNGFSAFNMLLFPEVKWEDEEPTKVELVIKK